MAGYRRPAAGDRLDDPSQDDGSSLRGSPLRLPADDAPAVDPAPAAGGSLTPWAARAPSSSSEPPEARRSAPSIADVRGPSALGQSGLTRLAHTIETEVVPNLVRAGRANRRESARRGAPEWQPDAGDVTEFAGLVLTRGDRVAASYIDWLRLRGTSMESIYLDLLAPSAHHLGTLWEEDRADFAQVTVGLGRLQQIMREMSPAFLNEADPPLSGRRALIAPVEGEQHTFGALMVGDFFVRAGWTVKAPPSATRRQLSDLVRREWFCIVGLSLNNERLLGVMEEEIAAIRTISCNREIRVMAGGNVFVENPNLAMRLGADFSATDARSATQAADSALAALVEA